MAISSDAGTIVPKKDNLGVERVHREHDLINQRITWLLTSQSVLVVGYGLVVNAFKEHAPAPLSYIPIFGLSLCVAVLIGVISALYAIAYWRSEYPDSTAGKRIYQLAGPMKSHLGGFVAPTAIPLIFGLFWTLVINDNWISQWVWIGLAVLLWLTIVIRYWSSSSQIEKHARRALKMGTKAVLEQHFEALRSGDLEGILQAYTEQSILLTEEGSFKGLTALRDCFGKVLADTFKLKTYDVFKDVVHVEGEVAYCEWHAIGPQSEIVRGAHTLIVHDGKISTQTFAAKMERTVVAAEQTVP